METVFIVDEWNREEGGGGRSQVLTNGKVFEKAGVNFSLVAGENLPPTAGASRPSWPDAASRRWVYHWSSARNPYIPTSHANVRFFVAEKQGEDPIWWFGGGYDLTPYYGVKEDCIHWHRTAEGMFFIRECLPSVQKMV